MVSEIRARPRVALAYLGVLLVWSTTPLGIKWSTELGFFQGLAIRMLLAAVFLVVIQALIRRPLPMDRRAVQTYLAGSLGIFAAMTSVYWASQHLPSGLVAVVFGMAPILTALQSALVLGERDDLLRKLVGGLIGVIGLAWIFQENLAVSSSASLAILAVLFSAALYGLSAVLMKRIDSDVDHISMTTGGLLFSAPMFLLTWWALDLGMPVDAPVRAIAAVVYLSIAGSVVGFMLYFYLLKHIRASSAALITLITPVAALILGSVLNDESLSTGAWFGAMAILAGLLVFNTPMSSRSSSDSAMAAQEPEDPPPGHQ
jgi:drug/metabolite transporter (DMT)-like permease